MSDVYPIIWVKEIVDDCYRPARAFDVEFQHFDGDFRMGIIAGRAFCDESEDDGFPYRTHVNWTPFEVNEDKSFVYYVRSRLTGWHIFYSYDSENNLVAIGEGGTEISGIHNFLNTSQEADL